jgi:hypothetical protein
MKVGVSSWFSNLAEYEQRHRTGAFDQPYPVADADQIRRELALAGLVEPLGFDAFWTIEHHFTPYGMTNNPTQLLTYMAGRTSRIELGTMVLVLPWHEPLKLAENLAILDILLDGRRLNIGVCSAAPPKSPSRSANWSPWPTSVTSSPCTASATCPPTWSKPACGCSQPKCSPSSRPSAAANPVPSHTPK